MKYRPFVIYDGTGKIIFYQINSNLCGGVNGSLRRIMDGIKSWKIRRKQRKTSDGNLGYSCWKKQSGYAKKQSWGEKIRGKKEGQRRGQNKRKRKGKSPKEWAWSRGNLGIESHGNVLWKGTAVSRIFRE